MPAPESEVDITAELVTRLVSEQHPELAGAVRFAGHGWDCDLFRLGEERAVRLPRRFEGEQPLRNEQRWLSELAPAVPVPIPVPIAVGRPADGYPWVWSIIPWFEGVPADAVSTVSRDRSASQLGGIVAALHDPAPHDAPVSTYRGVPLRERDDHVRQRVERLGATADGALEVWDAALLARPHAGRSWTHGDLHPANLLLQLDGSDGRIAALIDFGDLSGGDPAVDLAAAWLFFSPSGRVQFREAAERARDYDADAWVRARGWAVDISLGLLSDSDGSARMTALGLAGLAAAILPD
jgi:aminoglycoside phosphotransferase (APT) family kinase protein